MRIDLKLIDFKSLKSIIIAKRENSVRYWMWLGLFFAIHFTAEAIELKNTQVQDVTSKFPVNVEWKGHGFHEALGKSFLEKTTRLEHRKEGLKIALLSWGGLLNLGDIELSKKIKLRGKKTMMIKAQNFWMEKDEADKRIISAYADVTREFLRDDAISIDPVAHYIYGGYGLFFIYENKKAPERWIGFRMGLAKLGPSEVYGVMMRKPGLLGYVSRMTIWGAGGMAGNGSANLLNGLTVSGKEDWDGSSGEKWDVDTNKMDQFKIRSDLGLIWSMDPLLQWISAMGAGVDVDLDERK